MDSFLKIAKWSFLKPQESIQRKTIDLWWQLSASFSYQFLVYNNFLAEQTQCHVNVKITNYNFHWQPCTLFFIEYNGKLFVDFSQTDLSYQRFLWFHTFSNPSYQITPIPIFCFDKVWLSVYILFFSNLVPWSKTVSFFSDKCSVFCFCAYKPLLQRFLNQIALVNDSKHWTFKVLLLSRWTISDGPSISRLAIATTDLSFQRFMWFHTFSNLSFKQRES